MRPQSEIYNDVVVKVDQFPEVTVSLIGEAKSFTFQIQVYLSYMCCHYTNMRLTVEVDLLFSDENISIKQAQELSKKIQKEILTIKVQRS